MPELVRLRDIAARARVSVATVSLALRGSTVISAKTREQVSAIAAKLGYQPHPYVAAYMSWRRSRGELRRPTVALLHAYAGADGWRKHRAATLREMRRGVLEQTRARGYAVEEFWLKSARPQRLVEILRARGISGLIFAPIIQGDERYEFPWPEFSAVQIGTGPVGLKLPRVVHDHYQAALEVVRRCATGGHRRPGLIVDRAHDRRLQHVWRAGFEMAAGECGFARDAVWQCDETAPDAGALRTWLKRWKPDVLVTNLHELVESLLGALGHSVPRDFRLVSLSVPTPGDRVSGIDQNGHALGAHAVDLLASALQLHRTGVPTEAINTLVGGRWNPGETF